MDCGHSHLELLPQELLDLITDLLGTREIGRLSCSSKSLSHRLQSTLYGPEYRDRALLWACKRGVHDTIVNCLSYGASPSTVRRPIRVNDPNTVKVSTLYLAAKHGHVDTFLFLMHFGARIRGRREHLSDFAHVLGRPKNADVLRLLLRLGLASHLLQRGRDYLLHSILSRILGASEPLHEQARQEALELVEILLNSGVHVDSVVSSVNNLWMHKTGLGGQPMSPQPMSPLSAVILARQPRLVQSFLDYGAEINSLDKVHALPGPLSSLPLYVPAFAAAYAMATAPPDDDDALAIMELCLDQGVDLNCLVPKSSHYNESPRLHRLPFVSPLFCYLDSVQDWKNPVYLQRLEYLLDKGASLEPPPKHNIFPFLHRSLRAKVKRENLQEKWSSRWPTGWKMADMILQKWDLEIRADSAGLDFFSVIRMLVSRGALNTPSTTSPERYVSWGFLDSNRMIKLDNQVSGAPERPHTAVVETFPKNDILAWDDLIRAELSIIVSEDKIDSLAGLHPDQKALDTALYEYINYKCTSHDPFLVGQLTIYTVARLIIAGANINARHRCYGPSGRQAEVTILHSLCGSYRGPEYGYWYQTRWGLFRKWPNGTDFIRFLIEDCGADPLIRCSRGLTAAQVLATGSSYCTGWYWHYRDALDRYPILRRRADVLFESDSYLTRLFPLLKGDKRRDICDREADTECSLGCPAWRHLAGYKPYGDLVLVSDRHIVFDLDDPLDEDACICAHTSHIQWNKYKKNKKPATPSLDRTPKPWRRQPVDFDHWSVGLGVSGF